jgi:hypothetical protein
MSLFDFVFGLSAVVLGLGLAEMASRFQQLVFAGKRVKWAPEPLLLCVVIFMVILVVWLGAWRDHELRQITIGEVALQVLAVIAPYMAAAAVFPRVPESGVVDLRGYYDEYRMFLFGTLLVGQILNWVMNLNLYGAGILNVEGWAKTLATTAPYYSVVTYAVLMFVRWRWLNVAGLVFVLVVFVPRVVGVHLTA